MGSSTKKKERTKEEPVYRKVHIRKKYGPEQGPDLGGCVPDVEQQLSRRRVLVTSAGEGWTKLGHSAARIEGEREGKRIGRGTRKGL